MSTFYLPGKWETELEQMMLSNHFRPARHRAYLASPCKAETPDKLLLNMKAARFYLYYAYKQLEINACAPQAFFPPLLNDQNRDERNVAIFFGGIMLERNKSLRICGRKLTEGMKNELIYAVREEKPIIVYDYQLFKEARRAIADMPKLEHLIVYNEGHPMLAFSPEELFGEEGYYA